MHACMCNMSNIQVTIPGVRGRNYFYLPSMLILFSLIIRHVLTLQNTSLVMPTITEVCVNCTGDNCTYECRPLSSNNPFRINNIVPGENYTVSLSLRNDFGRSGESVPQLYGEAQTVLLWTYVGMHIWLR